MKYEKYQMALWKEFELAAKKNSFILFWKLWLYRFKKIFGNFNKIKRTFMVLQILIDFTHVSQARLESCHITYCRLLLAIWQIKWLSPILAQKTFLISSKTGTFVMQQCFSYMDGQLPFLPGWWQKEEKNCVKLMLFSSWSGSICS